MSYSIPNFTAKSLILDQLAIVTWLLHSQQQHLRLILLLPNYLAFATRVVNSTVKNLIIVRMSSIKWRQWKRMCMLLAVFILQYVSGCRQVTCSVTYIDILWYCSFSWEEQLSNHEARRKGCMSGTARKSQNGRIHMESCSEMLDAQPFGTSDDGWNSGGIDSRYLVRPAFWFPCTTH